MIIAECEDKIMPLNWQYYKSGKKKLKSYRSPGLWQAGGVVSNISNKTQHFNARKD